MHSLELFQKQECFQENKHATLACKKKRDESF